MVIYLVLSWSINQEELVSTLQEKTSYTSQPGAEWTSRTTTSASLEHLASCFRGALPLSFKIFHSSKHSKGLCMSYNGSTRYGLRKVSQPRTLTSSMPMMLQWLSSAQPRFQSMRMCRTMRRTNIGLQIWEIISSNQKRFTNPNIFQPICRSIWTSTWAATTSRKWCGVPRSFIIFFSMLNTS